MPGGRVRGAVLLKDGSKVDRRGGGTGDVACDVYPPRLVTVVRDRCSAGGGGWGGNVVWLVGRRGVVGLGPWDCTGLWMRWRSYHCGSLWWGDRWSGWGHCARSTSREFSPLSDWLLEK